MQILQRATILLSLVLMGTGCFHTHLATHPTTAPSTYRQADEIKAAITYLASDQLEGRGIETAGITKAGDYIATQFEKAGLKPAPGLDGYFQSLQVNLATKVGKGTTLAINDKPLELEKDYTPLGLSAEMSIAGPVVFVGYGITNPDKNYDDYAGIDVKGKIALALRFEPSEGPTQSKFSESGWSRHATFSAKAKNAADHGAIGLIIVDPTESKSSDEKLMSLKNSASEKSEIPVLQMTQTASASLLQQAGFHSAFTAKYKIDADLKPRSREIPDTHLSATIELLHEKKTTRNVIAYLPGTGRHKDEIIVVGAHYDHLGRGESGSLPIFARQIHNGADDNASGTAALIQLASELARSRKLDRSIVFAAFTGEERGLIGSAHFVAHPPIALDKVVAMINLDMVGRVQNNVIMVGGNGTAKDFDKVIAAADAASPLIVKSAGTEVGGKGGIGPSDHASFAMKKIPVLFLWSGTHPDYHKPTDDTEKINFLGVAQVVDLCQSLVMQIDRLPREQYVDKYDTHGRGTGGMKVRLGIMPDYNSDPTISGVRVAGTLPDAPAASAGLKEGDLIVAIDTEKIASLGDYMNVLAKHKPGDVIKIIVERDKQRVELSATLAEPKG